MTTPEDFPEWVFTFTDDYNVDVVLLPEPFSSNEPVVTIKAQHPVLGTFLVAERVMTLAWEKLVNRIKEIEYAQRQKPS